MDEQRYQELVKAIEKSVADHPPELRVVARKNIMFGVVYGVYQAASIFRDDMSLSLIKGIRAMVDRIDRELNQ